MKITEAQKAAYEQRLIAALATCKTLEEWSYIVSREFAHEGLEIDEWVTSVSWFGRGKSTKIHTIRALCLDSLVTVFDRMSFDDVFLACKRLSYELHRPYNYEHSLPERPERSYIRCPKFTDVYHCFLGELHLSEAVFYEQRAKLQAWRLERTNWLLNASSRYAITSFLLTRARSFENCRRILKHLHSGEIGEEIFAKLCLLAQSAEEHFVVAGMAKRRGDTALWKKHVELCARTL